MTLHTMSSFAPSLPTLPSYPRHLAPSRSASPSPFPQSKKSRPSFASNAFPSQQQHREYSFTHPLTPSATDSDNDDDGLMTHSIYSDREYRSSLVGSRKRGHEDDGDEDDRRPREPEERAGKRRIIDVVGGTLGGVLRGAWEMFRPRIPFYSSSSSTPVVLEPMEVTREEEMSSFAAQRRRTTGAWDDPLPGQWGAGAASLPPTRGSAVPLTATNPYTAAPYTTTPYTTTATNPYNHTDPYNAPYLNTPGAAATATEAAMSARWVLVSPTPLTTTRKRAPSTSSPTTTRRQRPVVSKKRGLKPPPRTPPCQSQQSFNFGTPTSAGKRHRKGGSRDRVGEDDLEMDDDMRRFNERLKAMIREGKEALGAKVEVVYDEDDDVVGMGGF
ncbi:hypothetical protein BDD12DRAFT_528811 [Trichophaea hybrida]|nr:hypothetical protein BDD12DRAFT_528811 [Trichophaea hybrida]